MFQIDAGFWSFQRLMLDELYGAIIPCCCFTFLKKVLRFNCSLELNYSESPAPAECDDSLTFLWLLQQVHISQI